MISSAEAFQSVVLEGAFLDKGMAAFAPVLSEEDAEAVRAFIVSQANL
jgi:mono/diheme cytochrome c family protein